VIFGAVRTAAGLAAALTLAACASRPASHPDMPWTSGRLSLRVEATADKAASSLTADFDLRGDGDRGELRLSSSLGSVLATARWSGSEAVLATAQGETRFADLDSLARDALGEALPLRAFPAWLAGRPWAGAPSAPLEAGFEQLGWRIGLAGFGDGRIDALRLAPPVVALRVRLEKPS